MKTKPKKSPSNAITSLPPSPDDERRGRMIRYALAMLIRLVCVIVAFVVPFGWWTILPAVGAVVLPYIAVVLANVGQEGDHGEVETVGGIEVYRPENVYRPDGDQRPGGEQTDHRRDGAAQPGHDRPEGVRPENDR